MTDLSMLAIIAAAVAGLYLLGKQTKGASNRVVELALIALFLLAVFGAGGGRVDGSGSWSLARAWAFFGGVR